MRDCTRLRVSAAKLVLGMMMLAVQTAAVAGDTPAMMSVKLPRSVELQVPVGWTVLSLVGSPPPSPLVTVPIDVSMRDPGQAEYVNLIAVNSQPATTYASIRIDSVKPPSIPMGELSSLSDVELHYLSERTRQAISGAFMMSRQRLVEFDGTRWIRRGGYPTLVTRYVRSGSQGPVAVRMIQIFTPTQEIQLFLSYRLSERDAWESVIEQIYRSVRVHE